MSDPDKIKPDDLLGTHDDLWGDRQNSMHDKDVIGGKGFMLYPPEPKHSNLPLLILIAVILAVIFAIIYGAAELASP